MEIIACCIFSGGEGNYTLKVFEYFSNIPNALFTGLPMRVFRFQTFVLSSHFIKKKKKQKFLFQKDVQLEFFF